MFSVAFLELANLLAKHTFKIQEYPHTCDLYPGGKVLIVVKCSTKLHYIVYLVEWRYDMHPESLKNEGIQSVHLRMMKISHIFPVASLAELSVTVCKLSDGENATKSRKRTYGYSEG